MENLGEGAEEGERRKEEGESVVLFILLFEKEEGERRKEKGERRKEKGGSVVLFILCAFQALGGGDEKSDEVGAIGKERMCRFGVGQKI